MILSLFSGVISACVIVATLLFFIEITYQESKNDMPSAITNNPLTRMLGVAEKLPKTIVPAHIVEYYSHLRGVAVREYFRNTIVTGKESDIYQKDRYWGLLWKSAMRDSRFRAGAFY